MLVAGFWWHFFGTPKNVCVFIFLYKIWLLLLTRMMINLPTPIILTLSSLFYYLATFFRAAGTEDLKFSLSLGILIIKYYQKPNFRFPSNSVVTYYWVGDVGAENWSCLRWRVRLLLISFTFVSIAFFFWKKNALYSKPINSKLGRLNNVDDWYNNNWWTNKLIDGLVFWK